MESEISEISSESSFSGFFCRCSSATVATKSLQWLKSTDTLALIALRRAMPSSRRARGDAGGEAGVCRGDGEGV
jgi:hypothetical protein